MKIRLSEIPDEGREYHFNHKTAELSESLEDLLGTRAYSVDMHIQPIGDAFQLTGQFAVELSEACSKCGWDLQIPLKLKINEILVEVDDVTREDHSVHGNQSINYLQQNTSATYYQNDTLLVGELVHEIIAANEPEYPWCEKNDCEHLKEAINLQNQLAQRFQEKDQSPFTILKNKDLSI